MAKIVIIDDEPAMVEVIVTLCREKGHQVFPIQFCVEAVEQLDSIAPQVVIADIKMETMTGFDVLRTCRASPADGGDFNHGLWNGRDRGRSDENGRVRLRDQTVQDRRAAADGAAGSRLSGGAAGERLSPQELKNRYRFETSSARAGRCRAFTT